ncbi:MAG: type II toxin-antitoxin system HicB family antitoxin [Patescibacteria group bacterium]|nr:type II toxin-antitoxin system HicB family antitoxin [Patescibacteria group bacterium]MCL5095829.1 type II toxin-antitoxin system HicB family antitoxin [Patescibacteria group bacterium]
MKTKRRLKSGLHILLWQEDDWYVVRCLEVEVASQGVNKKEALKNIEEALELYFEDEKVPTPETLNNPELIPLSFKITYA